MSEPFADISADRIAAFHDARLEDRGRPVSGAARFADGPWRAIEENHRFNARLWEEEDLARRTEASDAEVAAAPHVMEHPLTGAPLVLLVFKEIAKGASATLVGHSVEPPLIDKVAALPNLVQIAPVAPTTPPPRH